MLLGAGVGGNVGADVGATVIVGAAVGTLVGAAVGGPPQWIVRVWSSPVPSAPHRKLHACAPHGKSAPGARASYEMSQSPSPAAEPVPNTAAVLQQLSGKPSLYVAFEIARSHPSDSRVQAAVFAALSGVSNPAKHEMLIPV